MAKIGEGLRITLKGADGVDLSAKRWLAVKLTADKTVNVCDATTDNPIGILELPPYGAGGAAAVCAFGETKAVAGAGILVGVNLTTDDQGRVVTAAAGNFVFARALTAANAAGELVEIFVLPAGAKVAGA